MDGRCSGCNIRSALALTRFDPPSLNRTDPVTGEILVTDEVVVRGVEAALGRECVDGLSCVHIGWRPGRSSRRGARSGAVGDGGVWSCACRPVSGRTALVWGIKTGAAAERPGQLLLPPHPTVLSTVHEKYCTGGRGSSTASAQPTAPGAVGTGAGVQRGLAGGRGQRRRGTDVFVRALPERSAGVQRLRPRTAVLQH